VADLSRDLGDCWRESAISVRSTSSTAARTSGSSASISASIVGASAGGTPETCAAKSHCTTRGIRSPSNFGMSRAMRSRTVALALLRTHVVVILVVALMLAGCAGSSTRERLLQPDSAEFQRRAPDVCRVRLDTTKGAIVLEMRREWAPHGVDRFYNLVRTGYYDDAAIFRVRAGAFAQFGIHGDPAIARRWRAATIPDEPRVLSNTRGAVAFAFKDPNGRTTQVFLNLRDNSAAYDAEPFVPFARITSGIEVADALYAEYGERAGGGIRAGKQDPVFDGGNAYLRRDFPNLDYIKRATVVP